MCANTRIAALAQGDPQLGYQLRENLKELYRDMTGAEPPVLWARGLTRFNSEEYGGMYSKERLRETIAQLEVTPDLTIPLVPTQPHYG